MSSFNQSGTLAEKAKTKKEFPGERQCECCEEWKPLYHFTDEATELCDTCMDDWCDE